MSLTQEMYEVYADCHMEDFAEALKYRNLDWKSAPVSLEEAHVAFLNACKNYNNFDTDKVFLTLKKICKDYEVKVAPARESSPAMYIYCSNEEDTKELFKKIKRNKTMCIDDLDIMKNSAIRMWWD